MELNRDRIAHEAAGEFARREQDAAVQPLIECAQCGERLYLPEWSEWLDASRVRHLWACDACGYAFESTVRFAAQMSFETD